MEGLGTADVSSNVGGVYFQGIGKHLDGLVLLVHLQHVNKAQVHMGHGYSAARRPKKSTISH